MNSEIGVVICNYNKKDFVIESVKSVLDSVGVEPDIFVVDNASSDGSASALRSIYEKKITVIENSENLGGSG
ncbi:MAG: glycosyltransferase, partial [Eubacterium sp.]|nr:glycosyltransferase [Eubacterium sp.]